MKQTARSYLRAPMRSALGRSFALQPRFGAGVWVVTGALVFAPLACSSKSPEGDNNMTQVTSTDGSGTSTMTAPPDATVQGNASVTSTAATPETSSAPTAGPAASSTVPTNTAASSSGAPTTPVTAAASSTSADVPPTTSSPDDTSSPDGTSSPDDSGSASSGGAPNVEPTSSAPTAGGSGGMGGSGPGPDADAPLYQTDFEADTAGEMPDMSVWTNSLPTEYDSMGIVQIDASKAHSGSQSVYVKKGNDGQAFLQMQDGGIFPVTEGPVYVRAWVLTPEWPSSHVSWMEVGAIKNEQTEIRVGAHLGVLQVNQYPPDSDKRADGVTFAANEWHCIEYSYEQASGSVHVWLDGTAVEGLTVTGGDFNGTISMPFPPIEAVRFGAEINTTEAWFDDIAISKQPIGCD